MAWEDLDAELAATSGTISAYVGRLHGPAAYARLSHSPHYAASTMKVTLLVALYRAAEAGTLDLGAPVPVRNEFASAAPGAPTFGCTREYDNDEEVWLRLGGTAPLDWLAERMIVRSSNLAANLVLAHVGLAAVAEVWQLVGARHSTTRRGIEDLAARDAGLDNLVTAADLAALLSAIVTGAVGDGAARESRARLAGPDARVRMLDVLLAQERREDLPAGLPPGTRIAHKNGWVRGVRHGAGVVFPDDAAPYAVVVCTSALPGDADLARGGAGERDATAREVIARVSRAAWLARHDTAAAAD